MIDLTGYVNADGFVTVNRGAQYIPGEGNGWLVTGLALACGAITPAHKQILLQTLKACKKSEECPLIYRSPHKKNPDDNQACDDYWGALLFSSFFSQEIVYWGEKHDWYYNVQDPESKDVKYYFARFPDFAPFLRICAGQTPTAWEKLVLAATIIWDSYHIENADGNMKAFCKIYKVRDKSWVLEKASSFWVKRIKKRYGHVGWSWFQYFELGHPLSEYDE